MCVCVRVHHGIIQFRQVVYLCRQPLSTIIGASVTVVSAFENRKDKRSLNQFQRKKQEAGNTKGGSIIVPLTSCLTGLE